MRIGLLVSRQGPGGLWAPGCDACTMMAAAEVNASGGVLGRAVELVLADGGVTGADAASAASALVEVDAVDAVIGMHASNLRDPVTDSIAGRIPYVYAPMYEGGEHGRNVIAIGGTDHELLGLAVPWLIEHRRAQRFFIFGNDYIWPRRAALAAAGLVAGHGGRLVGTSLTRFGMQDYGGVLARIARSSADVVVTFLLGEESVRFNRAFAQAGLSARTLRLCLAIDETVLYAAGPDSHENLYTATTYVAGGGMPRAGRFRELYRDSFGAMAPPATVFGQSCYDSLHLLAGLAQSGRRPTPAALGPRFSRLAPRYRERRALPATLMAAGGYVHMAEALGLELKVVATRQTA